MEIFNIKGLHISLICTNQFEVVHVTISILGFVV